MTFIEGRPGCPGGWFCDEDPAKVARTLQEGEKGSATKPFLGVLDVENEEYSYSESFIATFPWRLTLPTRLVAAPVLDAAGAGAWDTMLHLMLHPKAESQDTLPFIADYSPLQWFGLAFYTNPLSRGSLLVWLDGFLMNPASPLDCTAGRFTNLIHAADLTPEEFCQYISFYRV